MAPPPPLPPEAALTDTVADCASFPPAPVQVSMKVVAAVIAAVVVSPLVASLPDHAPFAGVALAEHDVASVLDQTSCTVPPEETLLAVLASDTVGGAGADATSIE